LIIANPLNLWFALFKYHWLAIYGNERRIKEEAVDWTDIKGTTLKAGCIAFQCRFLWAINQCFLLL